jgi:hypothetical protein
MRPSALIWIGYGKVGTTAGSAWILPIVYGRTSTAVVSCSGTVTSSYDAQIVSARWGPLGCEEVDAYTREGKVSVQHRQDVFARCNIASAECHERGSDRPKLSAYSLNVPSRAMRALPLLPPFKTTPESDESGRRGTERKNVNSWHPRLRQLQLASRGIC